jgi:hypothetical protein
VLLFLNLLVNVKRNKLGKQVKMIKFKNRKKAPKNTKDANSNFRLCYFYRKKELLKKWQKREIDITQKSSRSIKSALERLDIIPEISKLSGIPSMVKQSFPLAESIPLLSIEVNFGNDMSDKITVFTGDNLKVLSLNFAKKHKLSTTLEQKLENMLYEQVKNLSENS